jgi:hypothetical protein
VSPVAPSTGAQIEVGVAGISEPVIEIAARRSRGRAASDECFSLQGLARLGRVGDECDHHLGGHGNKLSQRRRD